MRLWSLHPRYLDSKGLVALWRESLLAQKVLQGNTKGYRHHPQLTRFKATADPVAAIAGYLACIADEADRRSYNFDRSKVAATAAAEPMPVTNGQLTFELAHLLGKLSRRDPTRFEQLNGTTLVDTHPMFYPVEGGVEPWEII